jgi:hypothetical protein
LTLMYLHAILTPLQGFSIYLSVYSRKYSVSNQ